MGGGIGNRERQQRKKNEQKKITSAQKETPQTAKRRRARARFLVSRNLYRMTRGHSHGFSFLSSTLVAHMTDVCFPLCTQNQRVGASVRHAGSPAMLLFPSAACVLRRRRRLARSAFARSASFALHHQPRNESLVRTRLALPKLHAEPSHALAQPLDGRRRGLGRSCRRPRRRPALLGPVAAARRL